jgi:hypothetical protein
MSEELRRALLEAHVRHELARWDDDVLTARVNAWVRRLFAFFGVARLDELSSCAQIVATIERNAIDLRVSGGIVELTGEMAQLVLDSPTSKETRLDELLGDASYEQFAEKVTRLESAWRELISRIARSEAAELVHAKLLASVLGELLHTRGSTHLLRRASVWLELKIANALAARLRAAMNQQGSAQLDVFDPELVRSVADEVWASVASQRLSELFQFVSKQDIEDFVVLGYEFWNSYRKSAFFQRIMREMVEFFFAKYGAQTLSALIEDMGIDEAMLARELSELLRPIIARANQQGLIEQALRAQLADFYESDVCAQLLLAR